MTHFYSQSCSIDEFKYIYKFYKTRKLALNIYVTIKVICNPWFNMLHAQNMQITQSYQIWETIFQNFGQIIFLVAYRFIYVLWPRIL